MRARSASLFPPFVLVLGWAAVLFVARDVLIPVAFSILLSFALSPFVNRLHRLGLPRWSAVLGVLLISLAMAGGTLWVVIEQLVNVLRELPQYAENMRSKVQELRGPLGAFIATATQAFEHLNHEVRSIGGMTPPSSAVAVRLIPSAPNPLALLGMALYPLLNPFATVALVLIFTFFILLELHSLRDRLIRLGQISRTTSAIDEAAERVSRFLLMQVLVNAGFGLSITAGLTALGLPNAMMWGLLGSVLRFVPYLGSWIAGLLPVLFATAYFPGWAHALEVLVFFAILEVLVSQFVEPFLYGSSTGLHPFAVLASAVFWTWLWGGIGLLMATPLTVCLAVLGRHVPNLTFLHVLLSDRPGLRPAEVFYQRLVAGDVAELMQMTTPWLEKGALISFLDEVAMPALHLALQERAQGLLRRGGARRVAATLEQLLRRVRRERQEMGGRRSADRQKIACLAPDQASRLAAQMLAVAVEAGYDVSIYRVKRFTGRAPAVEGRLVIVVPFMREARLEKLLLWMRQRHGIVWCGPGHEPRETERSSVANSVRGCIDLLAERPLTQLSHGAAA